MHVLKCIGCFQKTSKSPPQWTLSTPSLFQTSWYTFLLSEVYLLQLPLQIADISLYGECGSVLEQLIKMQRHANTPFIYIYYVILFCLMGNDSSLLWQITFLIKGNMLCSNVWYIFYISILLCSRVQL